MQKRRTKKALPFILCMMLIVAMAFGAMGCGDKENGGTPAETEAVVFADGSVVGEGETEFALTIVNAAGEEIGLEIHTDKETVGEALEALGIINGDESEYGLYVKTVNGETLDFDTDGKYWAFYINGEYAQTGVDSTAIADGESYMLKAE